MSIISTQEEAIIAQFLNWERRHQSPNTYKRSIVVMSILRRIVNELDRSVLELTSQEIEDYLLTNYAKANTINAYRVGLKKFYSYCVEQGFLGQNPILFPGAKTPKTLPKPLTPSQQEKLLKKITNVKWRFAIELFLNTGVRRDELTKLRLSDFNEVDMVLRVRATSQGGGGKGDKERLIPITASMVDSFYHYLKEYRITKTANNYLFPGQRGGHMDPSSFRCYMGRRREKLGFMVTPHRLRHTFATNHVNAGTDIRVLQALMGHENISQTEKYTKVNLVAMRKAQEKGTVLGEKDKLIKELTRKNQQIEKLKKALREQLEKQERIIQMVKTLEEQD